MSYSTVTSNDPKLYEITSRSDTVERDANLYLTDNNLNQKTNSSSSATSTKSSQNGRKMTKTSVTTSKRPKRKSNIKRGRWELKERITFLRGLQRYGKGKWKAIAKLIPHRYVLTFCSFLV